MQKEFLDLTPLAKEWFVSQFVQFICDDATKVDRFVFDTRDFGRYVVNYVYDYQLVRGWAHVAHKTALMLNYEQRSVNKIRKKRTIRTNRN